MSESSAKLDVVLDFSNLRIQVDDVSDGKRTEFRASIYDENNELELQVDGWGDTEVEAIASAFEGWITELREPYIFNPEGSDA
jgi:hypothetical protein